MQSESKVSDLSNAIAEVPPKVSAFRRNMRVMFGRWVVALGAVILLIVIVMIIFAPLLTPYDPIEQDLSVILQQPSSHHLLGTDQLGRDLLTRIIYGARVSLLVGFVAVLIAATSGIILGLLAGYFRGWVDHIIMRLTDADMALPPLIIAIALAGILGGGVVNIMLYLGFAFMPVYCRLMYSQVISVKESEYVTAAQVIGAGHRRILFLHIFPNAFSPVMVQMTLQIGVAILAESALSFLGIGIIPPTPAWGGMVAEGYRYLFSNPAICLAPGIAIVLVVVAFNLVGDGLRDTLDPRLRGVL